MISTKKEEGNINEVMNTVIPYSKPTDPFASSRSFAGERTDPSRAEV